MSVFTRPLTVHDLEQFPDDGRRYETIRGELHDGQFVQVDPDADGRVRSTLVPDLRIDPTPLFSDLDG